MINVLGISQQYVLDNDEQFNVNNLYTKQPIDYREHSMLTRDWIDKFHSPGSYHTLILDSVDLRWIKEAWRIGTQTLRFPKIFTEELQETCTKHVWPDNPQGWFVRSELVSLKAGIHGPGPYFSLKQAIESIVTSKIGHTCFREEDTSCTLYLMKWLVLDGDREFRVFVYNGRITAISQQHWYRSNKWLNTLREEEIQAVGKAIVNHFEQEIKPRLNSSYVMDVVFTDDNSLYFIEPNAFGKMYGAGSALFHWEIDEDILLGQTPEIHFRYVK